MEGASKIDGASCLAHLHLNLVEPYSSMFGVWGSMSPRTIGRDVDVRYC